MRRRQSPSAQVKPVAKTWVTAVVVTRGRSPYLPRCLIALAGQKTHPDAVVLVDAGAQADPAIREMALRCGVPAQVLTVIHASKARTFGQAVAAGLADRAPKGLLWLLHDDVYAEPEALDFLIQAVERAPSVAIAGPKQVQAAHPDHLVEVGVTVTPFGRTIAAGGYGELDQGQHDRQEDVLGVGTAGLLVKHQIFNDLGGFDPALGPYRDGLEFCRRAHLAGHRVVVAPEALVLHEQASYLGLRNRPRGTKADPALSFPSRRRALIYTQLVEHQVWFVPFVALAALAAGLGRFIWRVASKEFGLAVAELTAPLRVLGRLARIARARRVVKRVRQVDRSQLRELQIGTAQARRQRRDQRTSRTDENRQRLAPTDIELAELRVLAVRRRRMAALTSLFVVMITGLTVGRWLGPGSLEGGAAGPLERGGGSLISMATGGWLPVDLGWPGPGDPLGYLVALFALPFGDLGLAIKVMFVLCPLLAAYGAWMAAGAFNRSNWVRLWVTLFYFASPALWQSMASGRLGAAVTHAALPWVVLGAARAIGANRLDRRPPVAIPGDQGSESDSLTKSKSSAAWLCGPGSMAAVAGAALAFAVAVVGTPPLLAAGVALVILVCPLAPKGRRLRLLWLPLPALVLFGPQLTTAISSGDWRAMVVDPGAALAHQPTSLPMTALGYLTKPVLPSFVPDGLVMVVAVLLLGAAVLAALVGLARRGPAGMAGRFGWLMVGAGLVLLLVARRFQASQSGLDPVWLWGGGLASLVLMGLLVAGAAGFSRPPVQVGGSTKGPWRLIAGLVTAVMLAGPLASAGGLVWQWLSDQGITTHRTRLPQLPAVAAAEAAGEYATRTLQIELTDLGFTWRVLRGQGTDITDPMGQIGARRLVGWPGQVEPLDQATSNMDRLVAAIVGRNADRVASQLALAGIGFVMVPQDRAAPELFAAMDATAGLARITENDQAVLWRVGTDNASGTALPVDQAGLLHLVGPGRAVTLVAGAGPNLEARLTADHSTQALGHFQAERLTLVLAERSDPGWKASLNGQALLPASDMETWQQTFEVPAGASGTVRVWYHQPVPWSAIQFVVLGFSGLLALPLRRRMEDEEVE